MKIKEPVYLSNTTVKKLKKVVRLTKGPDHTIYVAQRPTKIITHGETAKYSWVKYFGQMVHDIKTIDGCTSLNSDYMSQAIPAGLTFPRDYLGWAYSGKLIQYAGDGSFEGQTPREFADGTQGIIRVTTPTASVWRTTPEALTNSISKNLTPDSVDWDTNFFWNPDLNPSRLTARVSGLYLLSASVRFSAVTGSQRIVRFEVNGTPLRMIAREAQSSAVQQDMNIAQLWYLDATSYVECHVNANSNGVTAQLLAFQIVGITPEAIV